MGLSINKPAFIQKFLQITLTKLCENCLATLDCKTSRRRCVRIHMCALECVFPHHLYVCVCVYVFPCVCVCVCLRQY